MESKAAAAAPTSQVGACAYLQWLSPLAFPSYVDNSYLYFEPINLLSIFPSLLMNTTIECLYSYWKFLSASFNICHLSLYSVSIFQYKSCSFSIIYIFSFLIFALGHWEGPWGLWEELEIWFWGWKGVTSRQVRGCPSLTGHCAWAGWSCIPCSPAPCWLQSKGVLILYQLYAGQVRMSWYGQIIKQSKSKSKKVWWTFMQVVNYFVVRLIKKWSSVIYLYSVLLLLNTVGQCMAESG